MNAPSEKEFGVLIGEVRGISKQLAELQHANREQFAELQRANSAEHAANARKMERIEAKIEAGLKDKADAGALTTLDEKVDGLQLAHAGAKARDGILKGGFGALIALATLFAIILGDHIHL